MTEFVLDASVALRWVLQDGSERDAAYAAKVLESLQHADAVVPALWYTEIIHVLRCAEMDDKIGESVLTGYVYQIGQLPINPDPVSSQSIQLAVASVSREFKLTGYDAQYLELAIRRSLPIATLDRQLRKAAKKAGITLFLEF